MRNPVSKAIAIIFIVVFSVGVLFYVKHTTNPYISYEVTSISMEPCLKNGTIVTIDTRAIPKRGNIVAYKCTKSGKVFLSRVFALEGDCVHYDLEFIGVNSSLYSKNLTHYIVHYPESKISIVDGPANIILRGDEDLIVPRNHYFLVCDNWGAIDSRRTGSIKYADIIGVVINDMNGVLGNE